jgi:hypothetical protein
MRVSFSATNNRPPDGWGAFTQAGRPTRSQSHPPSLKAVRAAARVRLCRPSPPLPPPPQSHYEGFKEALCYIPVSQAYEIGLTGFSNPSLLQNAPAAEKVTRLREGPESRASFGKLAERASLRRHATAAGPRAHPPLSAFIRRLPRCTRRQRTQGRQHGVHAPLPP